jgi:glycosyltransferase involved in cell wall biosynthesis
MNSPRKLLIISHACVTAVNQQLYAEVERQTDWKLIIITPSNWIGEYSSKKMSPERWPGYRGELLSFPVWKSGSIPLHIYRSIFIPLLQKLQPDVIFVRQEPYAAVTAQVYLANRLSIQKPIGFFTWQNIYKKYPFPFQQMQNFVLQESCYALSGSYSANEVLKQKGYPSDSVIFPAGVDLDIYFPQPNVEELRSQLCQAQNPVIIGYMGRIVEEKGLKTLLYALKQIQDLPWHLVMVGSGSYETEFDAITHELNLTNRINRVGYVPHSTAPNYLSAFDLLVLPSETRPNWKEQFGRVIIEAIACGTPVLGSDSGEIPYLIQATGGGLTFQEGQPESLAQQLKHLIMNTSLRSKLVEKGRASVLQNYTNTYLAKKLYETIESVI